MTSRIVFTENHVDQLRQLVFDTPGVEGAAFILCGESRSGGVYKLVSQAVVPIDADDFLVREALRLSISSRALMRIAKLAAHEGLSVLFAHSHPGGLCEFSQQDDSEEEKLIPFLKARLPGRLHGTVVVTEDRIVGRIYDDCRINVDAVLSIGANIRALSVPALRDEAYTFHDRQIRAFGPDVQALLGQLRIGIVGVGGTGSPLAEQLYRLGVGSLWLFDDDVLDETNLNRVFGAKLSDVGKSKAMMARDRLRDVGLPGEVVAIAESINGETCAHLLAGCDIVFGCADKQLPRAILTKLALQYILPVIDLGVLIDSEAGYVRSVVGRVTTLLPGEACLFCRGRISPEGMRVEALSEKDRADQINAGYAPELETPAPAVVAFTSAVASLAVSELLHRLTGFMGSERLSSEVLAFFSESRLRTNRTPPRDDCMCSVESLYGRGDEMPFLGLVWASAPK